MATRTDSRRAPVAGTAFDRLGRRLGMAVSGKETLKGLLLAAPSSLWFLIFIVFPMVIVVFFGFTTFRDDLTVSYSELTLGNYIRALDPSGTVVSKTLKTLFVAAVVTLGALATSFPVAYYLARLAPEHRRGLFVSLLVIPFWISFVVELYAILPWVQREGYIGTFLDGVGLTGFADWLFGTFGYKSPNIIYPAMIYLWGTYMVFPLFTALLRIDRELLEAAQDLGAGKWKTFWTVTVPLSMPGILTGSILVFITTFGSFVEPQLLCGLECPMIGSTIYNNFLRFGTLSAGAAISVVVIAVTVLVLYIYVSFAEELGSETGKVSRASERLSRIREKLSGLWPGGARPARLPDGFQPSMHPVRGPLERLFDAVSVRYGKGLMAAFFVLTIVAWYAPLIQTIIFSFNYDSNIISWSHFSIRWYWPVDKGTQEEWNALFDDEAMMAALWNSFRIGLIVTAVALLLGTPAAMALVRHRFWFKRPLNLLIYTGLVIPSIVLGVSILVFINFLNDLYILPISNALAQWGILPSAVSWETGLLSIIVGHVTFCIPIVIVVLVVSLREFDRSVEEAAMNLGANEITTFFRVTLPIIAPGLVSAALLSFTFSFDELIVTTFLKGQGVETLPVVMWSALSKKIPTPELNAASTLIIGFSILFVLIANRVQRGGSLFRF